MWVDHRRRAPRHCRHIVRFVAARQEYALLNDQARSIIVLRDGIGRSGRDFFALLVLALASSRLAALGSGVSGAGIGDITIISIPGRPVRALF
jgi:hypothetical protein